MDGSERFDIYDISIYPTNPTKAPSRLPDKDFDGILVNCRVQSIDPLIGMATITFTFGVGGRYNLYTYTKQVTDYNFLYMSVPMAR